MDIDEKILLGDIRKAVKESGDFQLLSEIFFESDSPLFMSRIQISRNSEKEL